MRLLDPIILILLSTVDRLEHHISVRHTIASQFIGHDLPGFTAMTTQQALEETFGCCAIRFGLEIDI